MGELEQAISSPAPGREDPWRKGLAIALDTLATVFEDHVVEAEAPRAFIDRAVEEEPRLANAAKRLRDDHVELAKVIYDLVRRVSDGRGDPSTPAELRGEVLVLLDRLARHRQGGADLLYEAYQVDISVGD
jgi:hypothetical protein